MVLQEFFLTFYSRTCSIEDNDEDRVILTGGYDTSTHNKVSVFDKNGFVEQLPDLLTGRYGHACGIFINNDENKVLNQTKPNQNTLRRGHT